MNEGILRRDDGGVELTRNMPHLIPGRVQANKLSVAQLLSHSLSGGCCHHSNPGFKSGRNGLE